MLPIVQRELRIQARNPKTHRVRFLVGGAALTTVFGLMGLSLNAGGSPMQMGQDAFWLMALLLFCGSLMAGPLLTADCLSSEKRAETLGLLFLTPLRSHDIVLGKLAGTALPSITVLLATMPMLALPFLMGGISSAEFARLVLVLMVTVFFSLSLGLAVSAVSRDSRRAFLGTTLPLVLLCGVPIVALKQANWVPYGRTIFSPTLALAQVIDAQAAGGGVGAGPGLLAAANTQLATPLGAVLAKLTILGIGFLIVATVALPSARHDRVKIPGHGYGAHHRSRPTGATGGKHGPLSQRRHRPSSRDPTRWLASRVAVSPWASWIFWGLSLTVGLILVGQWNRQTLSVIKLLLLFYGLHTLLKCWIGWEASRRLLDDREQGALELLLTTPLPERQIIAGWLLGLRRRFLKPFLGLLALDALLLATSHDSAGFMGIVALVGLLLIDAYTLFWVGSWMGLRSRNAGIACQRTLLWVMIYPVLIFLMLQGIVGWLLSGSPLPVAIFWLGAAWVAFSYVWDVTLSVWTMERLGRGLREAANPI